MLQAVKLVSDVLEDFYATLRDEQKAQFESIGPKRTAYGQARSNNPSRGSTAAPRAATLRVALAEFCLVAGFNPFQFVEPRRVFVQTNQA